MLNICDCDVSYTGNKLITIFCGTVTHAADAISKLQEAIELDPFKHDTLWLLGKCFTISALKTPDPDEIKGYLHKALAYFKKASRGVNYIFNPFTFSISLSSII